MMRLPHFRYRAPRSVSEAARMLTAEGPDAMLLSGGTDLLPNMKRRQQVPQTLIALRHIDALRSIANGSGLRIGAGLTLSQIAADARVRERYTGLFQAVIQVATPHLRNMATIGGNICLDTRCNYYDQSYEWRKAINFCMKKDGDICWVATGSKRCLAVSSTDCAPALMALRAHVRLVSEQNERLVPLGDLYRNDGIHYTRREPDEILTEVVLDAGDGWRSAYWKLRRRGSFDFPVLSAAVALKLAKDGGVENARIVLGAVASCPIDCIDAAHALVGKELTDDTIAEAASIAAKKAKPMDNTDFTLSWRKRVAVEFVTYALREVRGDDMRAKRMQIARHDLDAGI